jgi:hypothetical protein
MNLTKIKLIASFQIVQNNVLNINENKNSSKHDLDTYINSLDIDKLNKSILKNVLAMAKHRLEYIFPRDNYEENVMLTVLLFLSKPAVDDFEQEKINLLKKLIENTKEIKESIKDQYSSGKFSFLIVNLVYYLTFSLVSFFLSISLLQTFENFNKNQIEKLIVENEEVNGISPGELKDYFNKRLEEVNSKINPDTVLNACLPYIFDPIKTRKIIY